jgi:hypothetical protein
MWNLAWVRLETVLVLVQDRCMICGECTTGTEIILDASDGTPSDEAQLEACLVLFGDSANLNTR